MDSFGFERRAVFDYCAKGDKPCDSKYCGISEVVKGLSRNILRQGVNCFNSCLHKSPPENDMLSRCHLMLSSHLYLSCPQDLFPLCACRQVAFWKVRRNYSHTYPHTHTHTHTHIYIYIHTYECERETEREIYKIHTTTLESGRPRHDRPAACVIAQEYSSFGFVSLCFPFSK